MVLYWLCILTRALQQGQASALQPAGLEHIRHTALGWLAHGYFCNCSNTHKPAAQGMAWNQLQQENASPESLAPPSSPQRPHEDDASDSSK